MESKSGEFELTAFLKLTIGKKDYFLVSFLGLHFSQTFLFLAASTQHLCVHSLPAFLASSQQLALTLTVPAKRPNAATKDNNLMLFITSFLGGMSPLDNFLSTSTRQVSRKTLGYLRQR